MESALSLWIEDCRKKDIPLHGNVIRGKALQLYNKIVEEGTEEPQPGTSTSPDRGSFQASRGWFDKFAKRFNIRSVKLHGEAASADTEAAESYPETFKGIIQEMGYRPEQVFNMDETGLFWKRMPSRTYLMKDEAKAPGFKAQKDRITLIMCGNAAGHMLKPGLIYKSANPRALKNKNKNTLPVYWMHNPKAWITKVLASDWFHRCFIPEVKTYLSDLGLEFKVLLIMDNAGGHPTDLSHDGVQIEFLPANTTSLIQPMDQGVIRAFKVLYTRNALQHLVNAMDPMEDFTLKEYWKTFTIASCLSIIQSALQDMKKETLNACWKKLWPDAVHDYKGFSPEEIHNGAVNKAVELAKLLGGEGFTDCTEEEVNTLIDAHSDPLTDDDLLELTESASEEEEESAQEQEDDEGLSIDRLGITLRAQQQVLSYIEGWDPQFKRALKTKNAVDSAMETYRTLCQTMKKQQQQSKITWFFNPKPKPSQETPPQKSPEKVPVVLAEEFPLSEEEDSEEL
ncbi:tigger transposable element-derived protein 1-like [Macrobrachium rosenbergii]|uniref:tigger transposable element-derived protein 1-like n=1 Tax=Macrobrachium rosenbergii TaxID=79674 RepID=UPI0034D41431